jgi:hypothetical protein
MRKVYVGLELASRSCVVTAAGTKGRKLETRVLETSERGLIGFVKGLGAKAHVLMEEGEMADWAWRTLLPHAFKVDVLRPGAHRLDRPGPRQKRPGGLGKAGRA